MRPTLALAILLCPLLAGCTDDLPTAPGGGLLVVFSTGCGFCSGDPDHPDFTAVALHGDGRLEVFQYGLGDGIRPGLEEAHGTFARLLALGIYGVRDDATLLGHATGSISDAEARTMWPAWHAARATPADPHGRIDATDCGPALLDLLVPRLEAGYGCGVGAAPEHERLGAHLWEAGDRVLAAESRLLEVEGFVPAIAARRDPGAGDIVAALRIRACGGFAHGCSGASGVVVLEDGGVLGYWGQPWDAGSSGKTACTTHTAALEALDELGTGWALPCAERYDLAHPRGGRVPADAWAVLETHLAALADHDIPAYRSSPECCDRVCTEVRMFLDGRSSVFYVEGAEADLDGLEPMPFSRASDQLRALMTWVRPSVDTWGQR